MAYTKAQEEVINSKENNMLVSASAGSGKTTVMIERILRLISEGESLENMVVVTFTKASAADMKAKLTTRLRKVGGEHAFAALKFIPAAEISTLHSWCQRIIKSHFYAIDVDPNFEVIEQNDADIILNKCIEDTIDEFIEKGESAFTELYEIQLSGRTHKNLRELINRIYVFTTKLSDPELWLEQCLGEYQFHSAHIEVLMSCMEKEKTGLLHSAKELLSDTLAANFKRNFAACESLVTSLENGADTVSAYGRIPEEFAYLNDRLKNLKERISSFNERVEEILSSVHPQDVKKYAEVLKNMTTTVMQKYSSAKKEKAFLDYSDLEHFAYNILQTEEKEEIFSGYKYVFVDEYQDISPLQESILEAATANMFFVGDVKQSIYAFRMCKPEIFVRRYNDYNSGTRGGKVIELNKNFRSESKILDFCNDIFSRFMTKDFGSVDYENTAKFEASLHSLYSPAIIVKLVEKQAQEKQISELYDMNQEDSDNDVEAAQINLMVEHIAEILRGSITENGLTRPVAPEDIAVILRSDSGASFSEKLSQKLNLIEVPNSYFQSIELSKHKCLLSLLNYFKVLYNSFDDIALTGLMLSFFGGFSEEELAKIREKNDDKFFYLAVNNYLSENDELSERLRLFINKVEEYKQLAYCLRADELAGKIVSDYGYFLRVLSEEGGENNVKLLSSFLKALQNYKTAGSVSEFVASLSHKEPSIEIENGENCIQIMTAHKSKGLEFPFVLIGNIQKKFNDADLKKDILLESDLGLVIKSFSDNERVKQNTSLYLRAREIIKKRAREEELRVLYVALTRAKYQLALFGIVEKNEEEKEDATIKSFYDWLKPFIKPFKKVYSLTECSFSPDTLPVIKQNKITRNENLISAIKRNIETVYEYNHKDIKTSVTRLLGEDEENEKPNYIVGGQDDRAGERGSAYHKIMELIDFKADFSQNVEKLQMYKDLVALVNCEEIERAYEVIGKLIGDSKFYREQQFVFEKDGQLVQGVIDLIIIRENNIVIVDYKTTKKENIFSSDFDMQTKIYAEAAEKILKMKVSNRFIYSFALGKCIEFIN